ncbi:hypothetical protein [Gracilinema caldarium]|uniref:hypothetical protein n=1 Tax=Gracilinema caldarium TaxID=215591 RepID=UPI0026EDD71B|nr:hypothetical protein [Gracilinema caldarium]
MSQVPRDFIDLFRCLNHHGVEYLIVGNYALAYHGIPLSMDDLDLFISPEVDNVQNLLLALEEFGFGALGLTVQDFIDPNACVRLGYPPEELDIISSISGVSWEEAWEKRRNGTFWGESVNVIAKDLLIKNKRARGRLQDLKDATSLEQLDLDSFIQSSPFSEPLIP